MYWLAATTTARTATAGYLSLLQDKPISSSPYYNSHLQFILIALITVQIWTTYWLAATTTARTATAGYLSLLQDKPISSSPYYNSHLQFILTALTTVQIWTMYWLAATTTARPATAGYYTLLQDKPTAGSPTKLETPAVHTDSHHRCSDVDNALTDSHQNCQDTCSRLIDYYTINSFILHLTYAVHTGSHYCHSNTIDIPKSHLNWQDNHSRSTIKTKTNKVHSGH